MCRRMHHMDERKLSSETCEEINLEYESDVDIPFEFNNCPHIDKLEELPEVLFFIKQLQNFIRRQQTKLNKCRRKLIEHKAKRKNLHDASTQTESVEVAGAEDAFWGASQEVDTKQSIAEQVKEAAQNAMQQTGFVYEETSGMYYDYNTGYYYNAELGLYYDGNSGTYYYYDDKSKVFQFHSQVETSKVPLATGCVTEDLNPSPIKQGDDNENKRRLIPKESKENKKIKHEKDCEQEPNASGTESLEEGECSDSSGEDGASVSDASSSHEMDAEEEVSKAWPPCMRIIVTETNVEKLKIGTLFVVPYTGGTMGREGDHAVSIPDINISKHHAKFTFDETLEKYFMIDFGSRNGTYLNGKRLSVAKQESDPHEVVHGSILQVGGTKLLCHIHSGRETCGHCEPGLVQKKTKIPDEEKTGTENKKHKHKEELKRIRRKFGLESGESKVVPAPGYEDRAQIRRSTVGSQDHHEKTQAASIEEPIQSDNKGFKMLAKMGWTEGQALGKEGQGNIEPVSLVSRRDKAGLGSVSADVPAEDPASERKKENWRKAQKRYQDIS